MSQENVEVVQRIWSMWTSGAEARDLSALRRPFDEGLLAPNSTFTPAPNIPGASGEAYVGLEGFSRFVEAWIEDWVDWRIALEDVIDVDDNRVVAVIEQTAVGRSSGAQVKLRFAGVFKLRSGQVVERIDYRSPAEALEAVGLSE